MVFRIHGTEGSKGLDAGEFKKLRAYQERVDQLRKLGIAHSGPQKLTVSMGLGRSGDRAEFHGYDEDHFRSAMVLLRQFLANDEDIRFGHICDLIEKNCSRPRLSAWQRWARKLLQDTLKSSPLNYRVGGEIITVERALDLYFNAELAHTDIEKWDYLKSLSVGGRATLRWILQHSLLNLFHAVQVVDSVIFYWIDNPDEEVPRLHDGV